MKKKPPVFTNGDISTKSPTPIITAMAQFRGSQRKTLTWNDRARGVLSTYILMFLVEIQMPSDMTWSDVCTSFSNDWTDQFNICSESRVTDQLLHYADIANNTQRNVLSLYTQSTSSKGRASVSNRNTSVVPVKNNAKNFTRSDKGDA
eukprot:9893475-Ditylum_brightwellii.AAC.1